MTAIEIRDVAKSYGDHAVLKGIDLTIERGEVFGLLGRNGAGKTTLVECMQGLRGFDQGEISVMGLDPSRDTRALHQIIGSQLQSCGLPDRLRVREAVAVFATDPSVVPDVLRSGGLESIADDSVGNLSGGQRQRLFIALAWLNDPKVIFLDEMTQGLDAEARVAVWDDIKLRQGNDTTVVMVSHFADELEALCDRVGVLSNGRIVATGTPAELIEGFGLPAALGLSTEPAAGTFAHLPRATVTKERQGWRVTFPPELLQRVCAALEHVDHHGRLTMHPPSLGDVLAHCDRRPLAKEIVPA